MPSITKDSNTLTTTPEASVRPGSAQTASSDSAVKQQPVALEIPVTVNGARTIEGSEKREPFSETTKTVLVFGAGAVIRLTSAVTPGQLLFLTNERTKKEIVCQVVKSKNYRSVSGYVELEFTESAVGFWGMRFPGDRLNSATPPAPAAVRPVASSGSAAPPRPVAHGIEGPVARDVSASPKVTPTPATQVAASGDSKPGEAKSIAPASIYGKPVSVAPAASIVPPPLDSAALLGARAKPNDSLLPAKPVAVKPPVETPLVAPWLKKTEPARTTPATPPATASPESHAQPSAAEPSLPVAPTFGLSTSSNQPASILAPSESPASLLTVDLSSLAPFFETRPAAPTEEPSSPSQAPAAGDAGTGELKQQTARLQEQLSKMNFTEEAAHSAGETAADISPVPAAEPVISHPENRTSHESAAQILESAIASDTPSLLPEPLETSEPDAQGSYSSSSLEAMEKEELKIPAWLEPLARNASAPSSTQELILREKSKRKTEHPNLEEVTAELAVSGQVGEAFESRVPDFGSVLPIDERKNRGDGASRKPGKGLLFAGIAAGVAVLAAASWWYINHQAAAAHANVAPPQTSSASVPGQTSQANLLRESVPESNPSAQPNSTNFVSNPAATDGFATAERNSQGKSNSMSGSVVTASVSTPVPREAAPVQGKKPSLGQIHLATPKVSQNRKSLSGSEAEPGVSLSDDQAENSGAALGAGLVIGNSQPAAPTAAPVAVGGDVKQAKLLTSVAPVYPTLARTQHIAGNVVVDALIDANGRVTETRVLSGPALLHEAATGALRQWKYQPATLDGKPVAMHLNVTIQFRLQQ